MILAFMFPAFHKMYQMRIRHAPVSHHRLVRSELKFLQQAGPAAQAVKPAGQRLLPQAAASPPEPCISVDGATGRFQSSSPGWDKTIPAAQIKLRSAGRRTQPRQLAGQ